MAAAGWQLEKGVWLLLFNFDFFWKNEEKSMFQMMLRAVDKPLHYKNKWDKKEITLSMTQMQKLIYWKPNPILPTSTGAAVPKNRYAVYS